MNATDTTKEEQRWKPSASNHDIIFWCIAFVVTSAAILCANALAIAVFTVKKLLRKNANILLLNLACADLVIGGIAMPLYICIFYKSLRGYQWRNRAVHEIYVCVDIFLGLSSMFTLAVIALERAYSVFLPFRHRITSRRFYWSWVALVWIMAGCLASLKLLTLRRILISPYDNHVILTFVSLALATIIAAYMIIWTRLTSRKKNNHVIVEEKSIVHAMLIVTIIFLIMWLPIYLLNVIANFNHEILLKVPPDLVYFAKLLQYCNSMVNPIVYSLKIPQFRKGLRGLRHHSSLRIARTDV